MNRDGKRRLRRVVQNYYRSLRTAYSEFEYEISEMKDNESDKLDSLPASFETSPVAVGLSDAVDMLDQVLGKGDEIIEALDDILTIAEVSSDYTPATRKTKITPEKKCVSFHALLSSSLFKRLKEESQHTGYSMNEIVCQALAKEFEN